MFRIRPALAALAFVALSTPALADRAPTVEERAAVEAVLQDQGFVRWSELELDDGRWEVDDAVALDGRRYDLTLRADTLEIVESDPD